MIANNPFQALVQQAEKRPDLPAIYYAGKVFSYAELLTLTRKVASKLSNLGIGKNHLVGLHFANPLMGWACSLALFQIEAISCSLTNVASISKELIFDYYLRDNLSLDIKDPRTQSFEIDGTWIADISLSQEHLIEQASNEEDKTCRLVMSSGSTGDAKAVPLSSKMLMSRSEIFSELDPNMGCELLLSDTSNSVGLYKAVASLISGKPFSFGYTYEQIERDLLEVPLTNIIGSPLQLSALVEYLEAKQYKSFGNVKRVTSVGSTLSTNLAIRLEELFAPKVNVVSIYGSTELGPVASFQSRDSDNKFCEEGHIFPFAQVEIVDKKGRQCIAEVKGEIRVKSKTMAHSYFPSDTSGGIFKDGWFYPGDLGSLTKQGFLQILGRVGEVFNIGGVKVNPNEVDSFLLKQAGIRDALCCNVVSDNGVDELYAAVVVEEPFDLIQLTQRTAFEFGGFFPIQLVAVKAIPQTSAGKPSRAQTRRLILGK